MYFSKLLNNFSKNSITTIYKKNNISNIHQKHIFYKLLQHKNYKNIPNIQNISNIQNIPNKLPICASILPYTPIIPYKTKTKPNTNINNSLLVSNESSKEFNIKHDTNKYIKILFISSLSGAISYSGLYIYLFINEFASSFFLS